MSTAILPDAANALSGHITGMDLKGILERVERRLAAVNLTANAASELAGKPDAIRNLKRAVKDGGKGVNVGTISALAPVLETTTSWLLEATGDEGPANSPPPMQQLRPGQRMVPIVGYAGAGAQTHFYLLPEADLDTVPAADATEKTKAIEIRGTSLGKMFDRWYAFFDDVRTPVTPDLIGQLCVVGLVDDRVLIKKIQKTREDDVYNLLSETERPIRNIRLSWAARVKHMSPR